MGGVLTSDPMDQYVVQQNDLHGKDRKPLCWLYAEKGFTEWVSKADFPRRTPSFFSKDGAEKQKERLKAPAGAVSVVRAIDAFGVDDEGDGRLMSGGMEKKKKTNFTYCLQNTTKEGPVYLPGAHGWIPILKNDTVGFVTASRARELIEEASTHSTKDIFPKDASLVDDGRPSEDDPLVSDVVFSVPPLPIEEEDETIPCPPSAEELLKSELQYARERTSRLENDNKLLLQRLATQEMMACLDLSIPLDNTSPDAVKLAQEACDRAHGIEHNRRASDGVKTDAGKLRWHLLPYDAVREIVRVLDRNAKPEGKYDERNWEKGIDYSRLYGATMRHLTSWFQDREDFDPTTGISHLAHAGCNILFLLSYTLRGKRIGSNLSQYDDRPNENP